MRFIKKLKLPGQLLLAGQIVLLTGLAAASFYFLYQYAEHGAGTSGRLEESEMETEPGTRPERDSRSRMSSEELNLLTLTDTDAVIRVQLLGDSFRDELHRSISVFSDTGFEIRSGQEEVLLEQIPAGCTREITAEELGQMCGENGFLTLVSLDQGMLTLPKLVRAQEKPTYGGCIRVYPEEDGIMLVNEVELEEYLCGVVSSEMLPDFPAEALSAQAICGRTYAWQCIRQRKNLDFRADLDDSVSFQVYNNYQKTEASASAVRRTEGMILNGCEALYYSTSCQTENRDDLGTEEAFRGFLEEEPGPDAEYGSPWLRWSVKLSEEQILENLRELYGCVWTKLDTIWVRERSPQGQVLEMEFTSGAESVTAKGEYMVRKALASVQAEIRLRDGTSASGLQLLPSAFVLIEAAEKTGSQKTWLLRGGGYGHGQGMSQYGAAAMAADGADCGEILEYYYG